MCLMQRGVVQKAPSWKDVGSNSNFVNSLLCDLDHFSLGTFKDQFLHLENKEIRLKTPCSLNSVIVFDGLIFFP